MNEDLVRRAIRFKMGAAQKLIDRLPPDASKTLKNIGSLIYNSIGENLGNSGTDTPDKTGAPGKVYNVPID